MNGELQLESIGGDRNPSDSDPLLHERHQLQKHIDTSSPSSSGSSSEIKDEDLEAGSLPCCRICLECDGEDGKTVASNLYISRFHLFRTVYFIALCWFFGDFGCSIFYWYIFSWGVGGGYVSVFILLLGVAVNCNLGMGLSERLLANAIGLNTTFLVLWASSIFACELLVDFCCFKGPHVFQFNQFFCPLFEKQNMTLIKENKNLQFYALTYKCILLT